MRGLFFGTKLLSLVEFWGSEGWLRGGIADFVPLIKVIIPIKGLQKRPRNNSIWPPHTLLAVVRVAVLLQYHLDLCHHIAHFGNWGIIGLVDILVVSFEGVLEEVIEPGTASATLSRSTTTTQCCSMATLIVLIWQVVYGYERTSTYLFPREVHRQVLTHHLNLLLSSDFIC